MTYNEAHEQLLCLEKFGINLGLKRIKALLAKLNNPQNDVKFIHIAGTNGKGSTSTMLANVLSRSGYKTGLFTSPEVLCFREYLQINGEMISEEEFARCAKEVYQCVDFKNEEECPTFFEVKTAIAFVLFKFKKCDIVCLEVGLGGEYDSTNIIPPPLMQIITSISLDHTDILGSNIESIARTKAGIIKGGVTVSYALQQESVFEILKERCLEVGSTLLIPDLKELSASNLNWQADTFCYGGILYKKSLYGTFQIYNALTVITAAEALQTLGYHITSNDILYALENSFIPARMEILSKAPLVILDGSHNPNAIKALEKSLSQMKNTNITIIMGVLKDKDYNLMLKNISRFATRFIAVTPNNPRALNSKDLAHMAKSFCLDVSYFTDNRIAIKNVISNLCHTDTLVVCGSLYLASEVRTILIEEIDNI
ncbi:MAG TPA: bifunctional folylpolyglutamate synthase/dihydrofolate synthase [Epulopiscium sp.]|nr:bifunctional folylpolyglutamate synthase/dihydrofolate synthase [Candidatus Epulonipiscium sp.]